MPTDTSNTIKEQYAGLRVVVGSHSVLVKKEKIANKKVVVWKNIGKVDFYEITDGPKEYVGLFCKWHRDCRRYVFLRKKETSVANRDGSKTVKIRFDVDGDLNDTLEICTDCMQIYKKGLLIRLSGRNETVYCCEDCVALMEKCYICESPTHRNHKYDVQGKTTCHTCLKQYFKSCGRCGQHFKTEDMYNYNHGFYCPRCVEEDFRPCHSCNTLTRSADLNSRNARLYCHNCFEHAAAIKRYDYVPNKYNLHKLKWDNDLQLGIEQEIETNKSREHDEELAQMVLDHIKSLGLEDIFYIKHDGTVQGFELISHPCTLQYHHKHVPWYELMKWLRDKGFTSYKSGNCGLHIHLSKKFFQPLDIHKLRLFFNTNKPFIYKFSKRFGYNDRYCMFEEFTPESFITEARQQDGKYWALRTRPHKKDTVEMRIFRGTLSYPRFNATIQFADALAHFVKNVSIVSCQKKDSWGHFIHWCSKTNEYQHFIKYIKNHAELEKPEV